MSFQTFVTERLAAITALINAISTNAKKIDELPVQENVDFSSKFHLSRNGISESLTLQKLSDEIIEIINNSDVNGVEVWEAQTFDERAVVIFDNNIYLLSNTTNLPFESIDFQTELNQGNWIKLSGLGVKKIDIPYPNVIDDSGMTVEDYLSNIQPAFQIKKDEILSVTYYQFDTGDGDITPVYCQSTFILEPGFYGLGNLNVDSSRNITFSKITTNSRDVKLSSEHHTFGLLKVNGLPVSGGSAIFKNQDALNYELENVITKNIFPEFKFAWGYKPRGFKKKFVDTGNSYDGQLNLLECNLLNGIDKLLDFKPQILLYRYKSKRLVRTTDVNGNQFSFVKKAKFYHHKPTDERITVIQVTDRKMILDFGLENFFDRTQNVFAVWANGMKHRQNIDLYQNKGYTQAHFYIHLRIKYFINGQEYISDPSNVLRVYYDVNNRIISYENT